MMRTCLCVLIIAFCANVGLGLSMLRSKRAAHCGNVTCSSGDFCLNQKCLTPCQGTLCVVGVENCDSGKCVPKPKLQNETCGATKCAVGDRCIDEKCRFPCGGHLCFTGEDYCDSERCVPFPTCKRGARLVGRTCMVDCINDICDAETQQCDTEGNCEEKYREEKFGTIQNEKFEKLTCATFRCPPFTVCEMRNDRPFCAYLKH
uniref:Uncharacterized protein n=1 Tax=Plectus sambesii TaxID=2011161 RepID=A0A914VUE9_9BILA